MSISFDFPVKIHLALGWNFESHLWQEYFAFRLYEKSKELSDREV